MRAFVIANALFLLLLSINNKFQTLTYYGFDKKYFLNLIVDNNIKGIDRVVPIGSGLNMNLVWDGYDIINILSRIKCFE